MLDGDGAEPPGVEGSDRDAEGNVSFSLVCVKNHSLTHHRNAGKVPKRPSAEHRPSDHSTLQKKSWDGSEDVVTPYDVGIPSPTLTPPPLPKAGGNEHPTQKVMQAVSRAITNEPLPRPPPSSGSTFPPSSLFVNPKPTD